MANNLSQIKSVNLNSINYPYLLKQISDPPLKLYYRGIWTDLDWKKQPFLAIVGSRHPSRYGKQIGQNWALELAKQGIILVSGLALGIDTLVHEAALKAKTPTVAILGCAIDQIYPKQNEKLYWQIIKQQGLVISEFAPGEETPRSKFVTRNRIITGLCQAVLLIEGNAYSGTLTTARYASQQGRDVLVLPGRVTDSTAQAPLLMLQQGATPVLSVQDILRAL